MGPIDLLFHLMGFLAPAFALALCLPPLSRLVLRRPAVLAWWKQSGVLLLAGAAVLAAGLWWFGRDGKMATYAALVIASGSVQWLLLRSWK